MTTEKQYYSSGTKWEPIVGYSRAIRAGAQIEGAGATATRDIRPCATMVEVRRLIDDHMLIEIEVDAIAP